MGQDCPVCHFDTPGLGGGGPSCRTALQGGSGGHFLPTGILLWRSALYYYLQDFAPLPFVHSRTIRDQNDLQLY